MGTFSRRTAIDNSSSRPLPMTAVSSLRASLVRSWSGSASTRSWWNWRNDDRRRADKARCDDSGFAGCCAEDVYFGTFRTREEAEAAIPRLREKHGENWAVRYHDRGFVIREARV